MKILKLLLFLVIHSLLVKIFMTKFFTVYFIKTNKK